MSIIGVRTELKQSNVANQGSGIRTDLTQTIAVGGVTRESSSAVLSAPSQFFGKALNAAGNDAVAREMTTALNTSPLTPLV